MSGSGSDRRALGGRLGARLGELLGFRSIRAKITFYLLAVTAIPILFLSYVTFRSAKQEIRQEILGHLSGAVSLKRDLIERWYDERRTQVSLIRQAPGFEAQAAALLGVPFESRRQHAAYRAIDQHLGLYTGPEGLYDEVFLMDARGRIVYSNEPTQEGKYKINRPYFEEGTKGLYIQNMYHSITLGHTTSTIALPVRHKQPTMGVLAFRLRVDRLHEVMRAYAGLEPEGNMYLVNNYNYFVTDPGGQTGYAMERVNYSEPVRRCLRGHSGSGELESYHGREVLVAFTYLPAHHLCILGELESAAAYQPVHRMRYFIVILTASTLAAVVIIAFFLSASISRPIRELTALTTRAAAGDLEQEELEQKHLKQKIDLERRDELGTLARSFDIMIANLRQRTQELARSNADLEEFAYVVSHDLKEPLRSVSGFVQLLDKRYRDQLDDKARDYIGRSLAGAERMRLLIEDLLSYARVSTGARALQTVDTNEVVQDVLAVLVKSIRENDARIEVGPLPVLQGEPGQLSAVFQNLIANALKFRGEAPPAIRISAQAAGPSWRFSVQDNGIGIEPAFAGRIFQVFQRLHRQDEYPGTGIGLAVCKKIVERHGGRIWLESEPGAGTTFHFTIAGGGRPVS